MKYKNMPGDYKNQEARTGGSNLSLGAFGKRKWFPSFDPSETNHERHVKLRAARKTA